MILHQVSNSRGNYNYNAYIYRDANWEAHFHGNYELIYVFEGMANITVNGISDTLHKSELILLPPYTVHSLQVTNSKVWVGVFSEDYIDVYAKKYKYVRYSKFKCREDILKKHLFFQGVPERFLHISCLYMVCNECVKNAVVYNQGQNHKFISEVVTYISKNLNLDITLKETAESLNYEYHYFSSLFHQYFCMNFKIFINFFRFEKACTLLTDKGNGVTYVAEACGFGSIRNFNRVFKKLSGYTPRKYKNQQMDSKQA